MKQIYLTQNQIALVDDADYDFLINFNSWCATTHKRRKTFYAVSSKMIGDKCKNLFMHRLLLNITSNDLFVDHIDGNGLNNQRSNLRICTREQNQRNRPKNKNNKSGYKGVFWDKERNKWQAKIMVDKKPIYLGRFDDLELAGFVYQEAARKYHKEYACI
jgi:hypothetical protein